MANPAQNLGQQMLSAAGRGEFIFDNFIPHGYAFAQVSVFGTEESSGFVLITAEPEKD